MEGHSRSERNARVSRAIYGGRHAGQATFALGAPRPTKVRKRTKSRIVSVREEGVGGGGGGGGGGGEGGGGGKEEDNGLRLLLKTNKHDHFWNEW